MLVKMSRYFVLAVVAAAPFGCGEAEPELRPRANLIAPVTEEAPIVVEPSAEQPLPAMTVLGGPCLANSPEDSDFRKVAELRHKALRAERAQDWADAVLLTNDVVRGNCSNEHWWFKLAEFQLKTGSPADAVATLAAFGELNGNAVDRRLRDADSPLHALLDEEAYLSSELAGTMVAQRKLLDARRAAAVQKLATVEQPPENYVAQGACPFECCMYGEWTATETTTLYREPGSGDVVAAIQPGKVDALGGEMRLTPPPVLVRNAIADYDEDVAEPGSIVFLLDYLGEGHGNVWVDGEVKTLGWTGVQEHCAAPDRGCWGEVLRPKDAGEWLNGVWWIQIKTKDGTTGWTSQAEHFDGKDGCS
jgi:hypothetical protein